MSNRLLDLEKSLGGGAATKRRKRRAGVRVKTGEKAPAPAAAVKPAPPAAVAPPPAPGYAPTAAPGKAAAASLARAQAAVNYRVPGLVAPITQPSSKTCWATVTTIMMQWKGQASMSIQTAIGRVGSTWLAMFNADQGLPGSKKAAFLSAAGLAYQAPQSLTAAGWEGLLRQYGPIWVTTDEDPSADFAIHARVMTGIRGDGTEGGTTLDIVDPGTGTAYTESFAVFLEKYESEARTPGRKLRIQIVHWPHDAGFNVARSLGAQQDAYAFSLSAQTYATVDKAEFEPGYDEARPGEAIVRAPSAFATPFNKVKKLVATDIRWAADAQSPDYRHLGKPIDTSAFVLKGSVIERLVRLNYFPLDAANPKVVFGLRGCTMDSNQATFADGLSVREIEPNHIDNRCIIGVWDSATGKIAAFQASTVPNWEYMESYRQNHADKANMLPCGRYEMVVGTHRPKKEDDKGKLVDNPGRVQGALRNDHKVVVLRSEDDLSYTVKDTWDRTKAYDNIHPGIVPVNTGTSTVPDYSSAGCSTIPGSSKSDTPGGAWAEFRTALGLDNANPTKHDGKKFTYVLLTGREARLAATGKDAEAPARLRFGSGGAEVRSLQEQLAKHTKKHYKGKADGTFDARTSMAFIRYQKDRDGGAADGVVTPTDASALGFTLPVPPVTPAKQLGVLGDVVDFARGIFSKIIDKVAARHDEGRFVMTSDVAEIMHDDTPSLVPWNRKTANFAIKAYSPPSEIKDLARLDIKTAKVYRFLFTVSFEYNGYDIREAQVQRVIQGSSTMKDPKLEVKFVAKRASGVRAEVSTIDFVINGKWDPGVGDKFIDFSGKLSVESDGDIRIEFTPSKIAGLEDTGGAKFSSVKVTKLSVPKFDKEWKAIFFAVDKDIITDVEMALFKKWVNELRKNDVRWRRLREGLITVNVDGYASPTGGGQHNQDLSRKRKDKVKKLLIDELGSGAKIIDSARGEADPSITKKNEKEDFFQRRAEVWFEVPLG
jgi:outer membrane protein OmpA-like peptidoglycan-associated protein/peptidoglycan hydrolase-like protein with peptidoglycan-binding domain